MKRIDLIKGGTAGDIAALLCDLVDEVIYNAGEASADAYFVPHHRKTCPAEATCKVGHNGFMDWLQEEAEQ